MAITQFQPCTIDGGLVKMGANCPVGRAVWYDITNQKVYEGNVLEKAIASNSETKYKVRCELTGSCVSDFVSVVIPPNLRPARPGINSAPANPENPLNVTMGVNSTISLSSTCPTGTVTNWNLAGYSPSNPTGQYISLTPTSAGIITATATCTIGACVSDVAVAMIINVVPITNCTANQVVVSPGDITVTRTVGGIQVLTASNCLGNVNWKSDGTILVKRTTTLISEGVNVNVSIDKVGVYQYIADCDPINYATCPSSITRTVTIVSPTCGLAITSTPVVTCGYTDFAASVTKSGAAYASVDYQWFYSTSAGGTAIEIVNNTSTFRADDSGERWYFVKASDKIDATCTATSTVTNVRVLKPTDLPTIVSSLSVEANNLIKVNKSGTLNLTVAGCPAFSTPNWLVTDPTGVLSTTVYSGASITLTGFLKTDDFTVKVKCVSSSPACETNYSNVFTVKVIDLNCDVAIDNFKGDAVNPAKTSANGNITINASGCSGGTITWYLGATALGTGSSVVVNKPIGTYTFIAKCSKGSTCTDQTTIEFSCAGPPVLSYYAPTTKVCAGNPITIRALGCPSGTITWYNETNGSTITTGEFLNNTYLTKVSATCTIGSCQSIKTVIETQNDSDLGNIYIYPNCDMTLLSAYPTTGFKYEWTKTGVPVGSTNSSSINVSGGGAYTLTITNSRGCSKQAIYNLTNTEPKLYPNTIATKTDPANCSARIFVLNASVTQNSPYPPSSTNYQWLKNGAEIAGATSNSYSTENFGNNDVNNIYKAKATYNYVFPANVVPCSSTSPDVNIVNEAIPTPLLNSNANCLRGNDKATLTASNCTAGKIKWFKDNVEIAGQSSLRLTDAGIGKYRAQCVGTSCLGTLSNEEEVKACLIIVTPPTTGPGSCSSPFADVNFGSGSYNQVLDYNGSNNRYITVTLEAYCIPDRLRIFRIDVNGNETALPVTDSDCVGRGLPQTNPANPRQVETIQLPTFLIQPNEKIRVLLTPSCDTYSCNGNSISQWSILYSCSVTLTP